MHEEEEEEEENHYCISPRFLRIEDKQTGERRKAEAEVLQRLPAAFSDEITPAPLQLIDQRENVIKAARCCSPQRYEPPTSSGANSKAALGSAACWEPQRRT